MSYAADGKEGGNHLFAAVRHQLCADSLNEGPHTLENCCGERHRIKDGPFDLILYPPFELHKIFGNLSHGADRFPDDHHLIIYVLRDALDTGGDELHVLEHGEGAGCHLFQVFLDRVQHAFDPQEHNDEIDAQGRKTEQRNDLSNDESSFHEGSLSKCSGSLRTVSFFLVRVDACFHGILHARSLLGNG